MEEEVKKMEEEVMQVAPHVSNRSPIEDIKNAIRAEILGLLSVEDAEVADDTPLLDLGLSSLTANELAEAVSQLAGIPLPSVLLYEELSTIQALATWTNQHKAGGNGARLGKDEKEEGAVEHQVGREAQRAGNERERKVWEGGAGLLLTGATGFLGSFILLELLKTFQFEKSTALRGVPHSTGAGGRLGVLFCLVRGPTKASCKQRLWDSLLRWFGGATESSGEALTLALQDLFWSKKIVAIPGDIGEPKVGVSDTDWGELVAAVDVIVHNGASVNLAATYKELVAPNLGSVKELVAMAKEISGQGRKVAFHFVSSVGVGLITHTNSGAVGCGLWTVPESTDLPEPGKRVDGYALTKYEAEQLLAGIAGKGEAAVSIYRAGLIVGSSVSGKGAPENMFSFPVRAAAMFEKLPKLTGPAYVIPVDYVAKALVALVTKHPASQTSSVGGKPRVYHIVPPSSQDWLSVYTGLQKYGIEFQVLPSVHVWVEALGESSKKRRVLAQFLPIVPVIEGLEKTPGPRFATELTEEAVRKVDVPQAPNADKHSLGAHYADILKHVKK